MCVFTLYVVVSLIYSLSIYISCDVALGRNNNQDFTFNGLVKEVIVVDDDSSDLDRYEKQYNHSFIHLSYNRGDEYAFTYRTKMMERNPTFKFIFKTNDEKGHAQSMNILMDHVSTKYFVYIEDDWEYR